MAEKFTKRTVFRINKFQKPLIGIVVGLSIITMILMIICAAFLYLDIATAIYDPQRATGAIKITVILSLMILPIILFAGIYWAYDISNRLLGPFERIIKELDKTIAEKKNTHIKMRKGDKLAEEVLKRINILIDKMP